MKGPQGERIVDADKGGPRSKGTAGWEARLFLKHQSPGTAVSTGEATADSGHQWDTQAGTREHTQSKGPEPFRGARSRLPAPIPAVRPGRGSSCLPARLPVCLSGLAVAANQLPAEPPCREGP